MINPFFKNIGPININEILRNVGVNNNIKLAKSIADVKDLVNTVKRRQEFRPFAPVVMEEYASEYFDGPVGPFMQYTSVCKRPDLFPAIAHLDNTSRVQTVNEKEHPGLYDLLKKWHKSTGCPIILNTSLNIKGEPMVNTIEDAKRWQETYNVKVFTND